MNVQKLLVYNDGTFAIPALGYREFIPLTANTADTFDVPPGAKTALYSADGPFFAVYTPS
jgi:hypothetical protein